MVPGSVPANARIRMGQRDRLRGFSMAAIFFCWCTFLGKWLLVHRKKLCYMKSTGKYKKFDPFIFAQQAEQVYYTPYPKTTPNKQGWLVVIKTKARHRIDAPHGTGDSAFQEDEQSRLPQLIVNDQIGENLRDGTGTGEDVEYVEKEYDDDDEDEDEDEEDDEDQEEDKEEEYNSDDLETEEDSLSDHQFESD